MSVIAVFKGIIVACIDLFLMLKKRRFGKKKEPISGLGIPTFRAE